MDAPVNITSSRELVVSSTAFAPQREVSTTIVRVRKPMALQVVENAFVEKTLHYISSIGEYYLSKLTSIKIYRHEADDLI